VDGLLISSFFFSTTYVTPPAFILSLRDLAIGSSSSPLSSPLPGFEPYPILDPTAGVGLTPGLLPPPGRVAVLGLSVTFPVFSLSFLSLGLMRPGYFTTGLVGATGATSGILIPCFLASAAFST
jgi:hypothetical protein